MISKLRNEAKRQGKTFAVVELTNHTGIIVDGHRSTLSRQTEIDETTARKFFDQFAGVLGKGWWR